MNGIDRQDRWADTVRAMVARIEADAKVIAELERKLRLNSGPILGIVDSALNSWSCKLNDAVNCGHSYCREHALVARIEELQAVVGPKMSCCGGYAVEHLPLPTFAVPHVRCRAVHAPVLATPEYNEWQSEREGR